MAAQESNKSSVAVWRYFKNKSEISTAECNICKSSLKNDRISNLKSHLWKIHEINLFNLKKLKARGNYIGKKKNKYAKNKESAAVWGYFENKSDIGLAECNICKSTLSNRHNSNLKAHLWKLHKINTYSFKIGKRPANYIRKKKNKYDAAVWRYFVNKSDIGLAECNICKSTMNNSRNSNLKTHLKLHKINLDNVITENKCLKAVSKISQNVNIQLNKNILFRCYIGLVTEDGMTFNILNSPNFRNIVDPICTSFEKKYNKTFTLNAETCKEALKVIAEKIRNSLAKEMKKKLLSIKIDSASRCARNIFAISAQYIKEDQIKSLILGMLELTHTGTSTAGNLSRKISKILGRYEIKLNQIVAITCDNKASMINSKGTLPHLNTGNESEDEYITEEFLDNISDLENPLNLSIGDIQIRSCAAHIAQLCMLDAAKDPVIKKFLISCRNLTSFIRETSNGLKARLELKNLNIPELDYPTRCGSTYIMLESLLAAKEILFSVQAIKSETRDEYFDNCDTLWNFMESYVCIFGPLQKTIIKFQEEEHLHYGNFYAQWLKCEILTKKLLRDNVSKELICKIGTKLLQCIERRTAKLLENENINACLFLDPRFHLTLTAQKRQEAIVYLERIWDKLLAVSAISHASSENSLLANDSPIEDDDEELLNSFLMQKLESVSEPITYTDISSKIANLRLPFIRSDADVLMFWKERKYSEPELYALSNICFSIPSSQVTIEHDFSFLESVLVDNYNRPSLETQEDILLVKLNSAFIDEAIDSTPLFEDHLLPESE